MPFDERTDWRDTPSAPPPPGSTPVHASDILRWERGIAEAHEELGDKLSKADADATYAPQSVARGLQPRPLQGMTIEDGSTKVRPLDVFGGYVWGVLSGSIHRRPQSGGAWASYASGPAGAYMQRLLPTSNGEVILQAANKIYRSQGWGTGSPTWQEKVTANGVTQFLPWGIDGNGTKFLATSYAAGTGFPDSRYVWVSLDSGATWNVAYDSVTKHGQALADQSHLHAVAYDPWSDRFYISEGHTEEIGGVYHSTDDGATWTRAPHMKLNPAPTTITPTDDGLVCGSDNSENGIYGVIRKANPVDEVIQLVWRWATSRDGLVGFAQRGYRDPTTGVVYIGFRSNFQDVKPIIAAGTPTSGALVYTWDSGGVGVDDRVWNVVVPNPDELLAWGAAGSAGFAMSAKVVPPGVATVDDEGRVRGGKSTAGSSLAVGRDALVTSSDAIAVGIRSSVSGQGGIAIGRDTLVTAVGGIAIGGSSKAASGTAAIGQNVDGSNAGNSVLIGTGVSISGGGSSVGIGQGAVLRAASVAIGQAAANAAGSSMSTAVGYQAKSSSNATSLGASAQANATDSTAIGQGATVKAGDNGSIALGKSSATTAAGQVQLGARHIEVTELATDPAAPAVNGARLYVRDDGAGKTQLCVRFATGAVAVLATEP